MPPNSTTPLSSGDEEGERNASAAVSYQRVSFDEEEDDDGDGNVDPAVAATAAFSPDTIAAKKTLSNFLLMAILFSANHGCVVSCLALASSRLGTTGAWQSGILMITYAASSLLGATYAVKTLGARNALILGMGCYCFYVGCFYVATAIGQDRPDAQATAAYVGAALGGIGAGFLWTAQGTYFGLASQEYASQMMVSVETSNAKLAGYFAFWYLSEEVVMRLLSSFLLELEIATWGTIFGIYTLITIGSTLAMPCVDNYPTTEEGDDHDHGHNNVNTTANITNDYSNTTTNNAFRKATVAAKLLRDDPKMKYMIGLNAVFGFTAAFLNSYVNGQVLPMALDDPDSKYVGILTSTVAIVAAVMSLVFGRIGGQQANNGNTNGIILIVGALCFGGVVLPFLVQPDSSHYGWISLMGVYALHGTGRATFEGTLRSTFADYFSYEKEGAFANIILQNGIASGIGYILTFSLTCETPSKYCIEYSNGTLHDVFTFEAIALVSVAAAIGGYLRASHLHKLNEDSGPTASGYDDENHLLRHNEDGVST